MFRRKPYGETVFAPYMDAGAESNSRMSGRPIDSPSSADGRSPSSPSEAASSSPGVHPDHDPFALGILLGVLIGEGHFGGDGKQPQVTLRMHVRHRRLFDWLLQRWPTGRLYGPYDHSGRNYYQLMFRGNALKRRLLPLLEALPWSEIDDYSY